MKKGISLSIVTLALLAIAYLVRPAWALQALSAGVPSSGPGSGTVTSVTGTTNQIGVTNSTTTPGLSITGLSGVTGPIGVTGNQGTGSDFVNAVCLNGNCPATAFGASGSSRTATCNATASNATLACSGGIADFATAAHGPNAQAYVPHAGTLQTLTSPATPTITNVSLINNETSTVPTTPFQYTLAQAAGFIGILGIDYNADSVGHNSQFINVGSLTVGQAEFSVSNAGVVTFNTADATRAFIASYYYNDTSGATTYNYVVAAISPWVSVSDPGGGLSAAANVGSTTTGNASLGVTHFNQVQWASLVNQAGYALYRGGSSCGTGANLVNCTLIAKVDDLHPWLRRMLYRVGDVVVPPASNGHMYTAQRDGYSGDSAPSFPTNGTTVAETPDTADTANGSFGVLWLDSGTATVTYNDRNQFGSNWCSVGSGGSLYEPNIPCTAPASTLADAFVSPITSASGTSIVLTNAPPSSATSVPVAHDDTAAYQAIFNLFNTNILTAVNITVPEGVSNISSPVTLSSNANPAISISSQNYNGVQSVNQYYGSQNYQSIGGSYITPGGGSVIKALDAMPKMIDETNGSASGGFTTTISGIAFIGYGVGQQVGFETPALNVNPRSHFNFDGFLNLYIGLDYQYQFSDMYSPTFAGDYYGLMFKASGTGTNQNNNDKFINPNFQENYVGAVVRNGAADAFDLGSNEFNRTSYLISSSASSWANFAGEGSDSPPWPDITPFDIFQCDWCSINSSSISSQQNDFSGALALDPAVLIRAGRNTVFSDDHWGKGDIHFGLANPPSSFPVSYATIRNPATFGLQSGIIIASPTIGVYLDTMQAPGAINAAYIDNSTRGVGNCHSYNGSTQPGCPGITQGNNQSVMLAGGSASSAGGVTILNVETSDKVNKFFVEANGTTATANSTLDDSSGDMKLKGYLTCTTASSISGGGSIAANSNCFTGGFTALAATGNVLTPGFTCPHLVTCAFQDDTTVGGIKKTGSNATTITFSATASDAGDYICGCT